MVVVVVGLREGEGGGGDGAWGVERGTEGAVAWCEASGVGW